VKEERVITRTISSKAMKNSAEQIFVNITRL
jgi:hypothetical protein